MLGRLWLWVTVWAGPHLYPNAILHDAILYDAILYDTMLHEGRLADTKDSTRCDSIRYDVLCWLRLSYPRGTQGLYCTCRSYEYWFLCCTNTRIMIPVLYQYESHDSRAVTTQESWFLCCNNTWITIPVLLPHKYHHSRVATYAQGMHKACTSYAQGVCGSIPVYA